MYLDRSLQKEMLVDMAATYPRPCPNVLKKGGPEQLGLRDINLHYLEEHGLVKRIISQPFAGGASMLMGYTITARGLDFLADDGGLTAILGVVTVKLHEDTLRALIADKVKDSDLPEPEKKRLLEQIRDLQPDAIKHLTMKLLDQGLESTGKVIGLIAGMAG